MNVKDGEEGIQGDINESFLLGVRMRWRGLVSHEFLADYDEQKLVRAYPRSMLEKKAAE